MLHLTTREELVQIAQSYIEHANVNKYTNTIREAYIQGFYHAERLMAQKLEQELEAKQEEEKYWPTIQEIANNAPRQYSVREISTITGLREEEIIQVMNGTWPKLLFMTKKRMSQIFAILFDVSEDMIRQALRDK